MYVNKKFLKTELDRIKNDGLYKKERIIESDQNANISVNNKTCLLYTSPSPRDKRQSRMPSSA